MKPKKKSKIFFLCALIICSLLYPLTVSADIPYSAYTYDSEERPIWMPSPYIPVEILGQSLYLDQGNGEHQVVKGLATPEDLCIDREGFLYAADKDNNRIVKFDREGVIRQQFGITEEGSILRGPEGVYVDEDGLVYAADTGNQKIVVFNQENEVVNTIEKPDDIRIKDVVFTPVKLSVDARGYLFVVSRGGNEGLLILSPDGKFHGFFGRNTTEVTLTERIKRLFYTKEQIATNNNSRAVTISGVTAGTDGYLYTCTQNMKSGQIKKFNANGEDLFDNTNFQVKIPSRITNGKEKESSIAAITVDHNSNIYAADQNNGAVIIYASQGQTLTIFGSKLSSNEQRVGVFGMINGIAVAPDGVLYVLDKQYNGIHVFQPTEMFQKILQAMALYNDGLYQDAVPLWKDILKANSNYYLAHLGLGKAAYVEKDWEEAMAQMRVALDQKGYSEAFWQYRSIWIQKNITNALLIIVCLVVLHQLILKLFRFSPTGWTLKKIKGVLHWTAEKTYARIPIAKVKQAEAAFAFGTCKHPIDTFYEATRRGKGSVTSGIIIWALYVIVKLLAIACTSFSFEKFGLVNMELTDIFLQFIAPMMLWIFGVYLVGAITKGQGSLKAVFITGAYCLIPQIVLCLPIALISNILSRSESFIYFFFVFLATAWTLLLMFVQVKEVQGYEFGETIKRILAVLFTIAVTLVLIAAVSGISVQAYNLANELIREVLGIV